METPVEHVEYSPEQLQHYGQLMESQGYFIIPDLLSPQELEEARTALDEIFVREAAIGPEREWHTPLYMVSYMLPQKHAFFRSLPLHPKILPLMRHILGETLVMSSMNGFTMTPGSTDQPLHLDQLASVPGVVLNINAMLCLDDYTEENGATRVIPGSHKEIFDRRCDRSLIEHRTIQLTAKAGSLVAFDGGLIHAGSHNATEKYRRGLHLFYARPWVRPQWDFTRSFSADVLEVMTKEEMRIYGVYRPVPYYDAENDVAVPMYKKNRENANKDPYA